MANVPLMTMATKNQSPIKFWHTEFNFLITTAYNKSLCDGLMNRTGRVFESDQANTLILCLIHSKKHQYRSDPFSSEDAGFRHCFHATIVLDGSPPQLEPYSNHYTGYGAGGAGNMLPVLRSSKR
jgi:hypothetical protein